MCVTQSEVYVMESKYDGKCMCDKVCDGKSVCNGNCVCICVCVIENDSC